MESYEMATTRKGWWSGAVVLAILGLAVGPAYGGFSLSGFNLQVIQSQQGVNNGAANFQTVSLWESSDLGVPVSTAFTLPSCQGIAASRLYLDIWGGENTYTAQITASLNGTALPTIKIGGTSDKNPTYSTTSTSVYGSGFGTWQVAFSTSNVTPLLYTNGTPNVLNFTITDSSGNFDGRVYCATLVTIYTDLSIASRLDYYLVEADGSLGDVPGGAGFPAQRSVTFSGLNLAGVVSAQYAAEYLLGASGQHSQVYFNGTALGGPQNNVATVGELGPYGPNLPTFNVTSLLTSNSTVRNDVADADVGSPGQTYLQANVSLLTVQHAVPVTLAMQVSPPGTGTVTVTPSQASYMSGSTITIQATANFGYAFLNWSVTGGSVTNAGSATTSLMFTGSCTLTANFAVGNYNVTGVASPALGGTVNIGSPTGTTGQAISISQTTNAGYTFTGWTVNDGGHGAALSSNSTAVIVGAAAVTVTANYAPASYSGTEITAAGGTVILSDSGPYTYGEQSTVTASAQAGYFFSGWSLQSGAASQLDNPANYQATLTVYDDFTLTATFTATTVQFVTVGDAGNAPDTDGLGAVGYVYQIGTYDVTTVQYAAFLNAVATSGDPYDLYNSAMATDYWACGIIQNGAPGSYSYAVVPGQETLPVNSVSWGDAARFCNWLENGQPVGPEGPGTTETGAYTLSGATTDAALMAVTRNPGATYFIPSANEWYKAAFYKGGSRNAGYWLYPTQNNNPPSNVVSASGTNNANYNLWFLTPVGAFADSPGPYGTFDQGGLLFQWTETILTSDYGPGFAMYNSSFMSAVDELASNNTIWPWSPTDQYDFLGFRVAALASGWQTLTVTASTSAPWVYQNTPATTKDRHAVTLAVNVTQDSWGNHSYTVTVTQSGTGVVTPTAVWTSGTTLTPALSATWSGLTGYLVGGRVQGGGVVGSAANLATTGSCTVTVTVVGDVSGPSNPATTTLTLTVAPLGDIDGSGQVDQKDLAIDLAILNARLNAFDITPYTDANCDLSGDGAVTTADRVLLNKILNGLAVP